MAPVLRRQPAPPVFRLGIGNGEAGIHEIRLPAGRDDAVADALRDVPRLGDGLSRERLAAFGFDRGAERCGAARFQRAGHGGDGDAGTAGHHRAAAPVGAPVGGFGPVPRAWSAMP